MHYCLEDLYIWLINGMSMHKLMTRKTQIKTQQTKKKIIISQNQNIDFILVIAKNLFRTQL